MTAHLLLTKCRHRVTGSKWTVKRCRIVRRWTGNCSGRPPEHRWLKTDQQVRLHLNRFSPTTVEGQARASLTFNVQLLEDKACWQIFSYDSSVHKQCDDVLKISQERNYLRNAAADSKQEFFFTSFSHLSAREYIFLSVYSRFILPLLLNNQQSSPFADNQQSENIPSLWTRCQIRHHRDQTFLLPSHPESGSWLVGCVSRQN